jgi:two-component system alkaline phosphatase synthesis response regulator PhoP
MTTAKGTEYDKVIGLDSGADDYLAKPFGMMELISRVKAVLRRSAPKNSADILQIGNLVLNKDTHTVLADNNKIVLTLKEYELLSTFMSNIGYVFSREQLLHCVWGSDYSGETRTIDVHIGTLRTKLGSCGNYIQTIRGVGYKMEE